MRVLPVGLVGGALLRQFRVLLAQLTQSHVNLPDKPRRPLVAPAGGAHAGCSNAPRTDARCPRRQMPPQSSEPPSPYTAIPGENMTLTKRFQEALTFAAELHSTQTRKGTDIPYVAHLLAVCSTVLEKGGTEDQAIAALLHDGIEDQGGAPTREVIRGRFGDRVVEIVDGCTDAEGEPKPPWRQRKEAYLAHLRDAPAAVLLVSAADKLHNARAVLTDYRELGEALWDRFNGGRKGTLWYYQSLVDVLGANPAAPQQLASELARTVGELVRLAEGNAPSGAVVAAAQEPRG